MPSPTSMKPYPLAALNHLTLPSGITNLLLRKPQPGSRASSDGTECPAKATILWPSRWRLCKSCARKQEGEGFDERFRGLFCRSLAGRQKEEDPLVARAV